jgi:hypothetical protein
MKERTIIQCIVGLLAAVVIIVTGSTDLIYVGAALLFFVMCIAFAAWCEHL